MGKVRVDAGPSVHDPEPTPEPVPDEPVADEAAEPVQVEQEPEPEVPEPEVPLSSAPKAAWVAYAMNKGESEEEANAATKAELIADYGS